MTCCARVLVACDQQRSAGQCPTQPDSTTGCLRRSASNCAAARAGSRGQLVASSRGTPPGHVVDMSWTCSGHVRARRVEPMHASGGKGWVKEHKGQYYDALHVREIFSNTKQL